MEVKKKVYGIPRWRFDFILLITVVCCWSLMLFTTPTTAKETKSTTPAVTTPKPTSEPPSKYCPMFNKSCEKCVLSVKCIYCYVDETCKPYPVGHVLPKSSQCPFSKTRWSNCLINFEALLISMGVIAGLCLFSCILCIYCCCCRKSKRLKYMADEVKFERQKEERRIKSDERKQERQQRNDEIRKKYGLVKEENPYRRFDA
ncbi:pituitary tumor-transforming gene 1 protein-interacting protein isoform X2 [Octopus sinensis]|uniref:Pituitary tumor-transforming gene 1 protein-interacting protein isoform X2 n=1 Tax=Octopus sinensis TaxID=2607531 RepID=A0A7E6FSK1_9MOLL|nr:pituitary tumor-transforming gene 1 protein-interacting protein isoform X2 [Octopus sinensis]